MSRNTHRQQRTHRELEEYSEKLMGLQIIEVVCDNQHKQQIKYVGVSREFAEMQCGLLDGTSPMYLFPPGPESSIGKCGICGAKITAKVVE